MPNRRQDTRRREDRKMAKLQAEMQARLVESHTLINKADAQLHRLMDVIDEKDAEIARLRILLYGPKPGRVLKFQTEVSSDGGRTEDGDTYDDRETL